MNGKQKQPLVVIVGPTAVGKTTVSIQLAQRLEGEIVSADSRLLYRGMNIGTAKPTEEEMQTVPHYLIDVADPDENWSLGLYQREAYKIIDAIFESGKLPILVGGTGQYIRSIIEGWQIPPQKPDYGLRDALYHWAGKIGAEALYERLKRLDPEAAKRIDYRNLRRTVRALEVVFLTGKKFSDLRRKQECPYHPIILGIDRSRDELYERIDRRIEQMMDEGFVEEVERLLTQGFSPELPTMSAIGYREMIQHLQGELSLAEAVTLIKRNTRIFVRRQANWFKKGDTRITWFAASENLVDIMAETIEKRLKENDE